MLRRHWSHLWSFGVLKLQTTIHPLPISIQFHQQRQGGLASHIEVRSTMYHKAHFYLLPRLKQNWDTSHRARHTYRHTPIRNHQRPRRPNPSRTKRDGPCHTSKLSLPYTPASILKIGSEMPTPLEIECSQPLDPLQIGQVLFNSLRVSPYCKRSLRHQRRLQHRSLRSPESRWCSLRIHSPPLHLSHAIILAVASRAKQLKACGITKDTTFRKLSDRTRVLNAREGSTVHARLKDTASLTAWSVATSVLRHPVYMRRKGSVGRIISRGTIAQSIQSRSLRKRQIRARQWVTTQSIRLAYLRRLRL